MNLLDYEIIRGYNFLKRQAKKKLKAGDIYTAHAIMEKCCMVANHLTWMFHDEDISYMVDEISSALLPRYNGTYTTEKKRVVFYDQYGKSFILALQYVDALIAAGYEIQYILSDYVQANEDTFILDYLRSQKNIHVHIIPLNTSIQERVAQIQSLTIDFCPEKLFLHVKAFSAFNLVLPALPDAIETYYIDLQDHAFWVKNHQIDYVMPYRYWGATIDVEKRGFKKEQVFLMPYYPIIQEKEFLGFPKGVEGKIIIFTGGELYKTRDWDNSYWNIVIRVLAENPQTVILYATKGDVSSAQRKALEVYAKDKTIANRLIPIGFRTDINEVFKHCDIYLGTAPMSGGLMCQYAAANKKPILQYYRPDMATNNETEQVLNYNGEVNISFTDMDDLLKEAQHLISDAEYRQQVGEEIYNCMIRKDQFDTLLEKTITTNQNQVPIQWQTINYKRYEDWWFYLEKIDSWSSGTYLSSLLKRWKFFVMPITTIQKYFIGNRK